MIESIRHLNRKSFISLMGNYQELLENRVHQIFEELSMENNGGVAFELVRQELKQKHPDTYLHSLRTCILSYESARALQQELAIADVKPAVYAGLGHDNGKSRQEEARLKKITDFTEEDREKVSSHPIDSYNQLKDAYPVVALLSLGHHTLQEGKYPADEFITEKINQVPAGLRETVKKLYYLFLPILAIADTYDAMVTRDSITNDNKKFGGKIPPEHTKEIMLKHFKNPEVKKLVRTLYNKGVLGTDYNKVLGLPA